MKKKIKKNIWAVWRPVYKYSWAVWQRKSYVHYANIVNKLSDAVILDIGTGTGEYIKYIRANNGVRFIFSDPDPKALEIAMQYSSRQGLNCEFIVGNADEVIKLVDNCTHVSLIHVLSVIDNPFEFVDAVKTKFSNVKIYAYLSKLNAKRNSKGGVGRAGFRRLDKDQLLEYFVVEPVNYLNNVYKLYR